MTEQAEASETTEAATNGADSAAAVGATAPEAVLKASTTKAPETAPELLRSDAGDVEATTVSMERSGAEQITAQRVVMERSGVRSLNARSAQLDRSGVVSLQAERAVLHAGSAVVVSAHEARLVRSRALLVASGNTVVEGGLTTLFHAGPVTGEVRPVLDGRRAIQFGAAFGFVVLILGGLARRLAGRR